MRLFTIFMPARRGILQPNTKRPSPRAARCFNIDDVLEMLDLQLLQTMQLLTVSHDRAVGFLQTITNPLAPLVSRWKPPSPTHKNMEIKIKNPPTPLRTSERPPAIMFSVCETVETAVTDT